MIAGDGDHVIQSQFICIDQTGQLVPQQSSSLQPTNKDVHCCAVINVLALVPGLQPSGEEAP